MQSHSTPSTSSTSKLSAKLARRAEHLRASLPAREAAAIEAANREREAWLEWRRLVKARRAASQVEQMLLPSGGLGKESAGSLGRKDRKSRALRGEADRTKKERKMAKLDALLFEDENKASKEKKTPSATAAPGPVLEKSSSIIAPKPRQATATAVQASTSPANLSTWADKAVPTPAATLATPPPSPLRTPAFAPLASTSTLASRPPSFKPPTMAYINMVHSDSDSEDWSDEYDSDDEDPEWQDLDEDSDYDGHLSSEAEDDRWNFSLPTLVKMASAVSDHVAAKEAAKGWGVLRFVGSAAPGVLLL